MDHCACLLPATDAYCLLEVYKVLTAKIVAYEIPIQIRSEAGEYNDCIKKTKLEKKQDRISKKCDMPLSEVMIVMVVFKQLVAWCSGRTLVFDCVRPTADG